MEVRSTAPGAKQFAAAGFTVTLLAVFACVTSGVPAPPAVTVRVSLFVPVIWFPATPSRSNAAMAKVRAMHRLAPRVRLRATAGLPCVGCSVVIMVECSNGVLLFFSFVSGIGLMIFTRVSHGTTAVGGRVLLLSSGRTLARTCAVHVGGVLLLSSAAAGSFFPWRHPSTRGVQMRHPCDECEHRRAFR